jgi:phosphohistidine phosphatase SixA
MKFIKTRTKIIRRMMKKSLLITMVILLSISFWVKADTDSTYKKSTNNIDQYTLYLVRHAEKQKTKDNPPLTECGQQRAQQLATILNDVTIKRVYSTQYQRTLSTAQPIAKQKGLTIEQYRPNALSQFALHLTTQKENAVIVGHSNTTPQLAQLISNKEVNKLPEHEYQTLYQIQVIGEVNTLTILKQPLVCSMPAR